MSRPTLVPLERTVPIEVFKAEVTRWAERIGVKPKEIHVRDMKRKWASCSSHGRLTFDIDLLREAPDFRDKVIVHELVHLKVPNHGKLFRHLVQSHLALRTDNAGSGASSDWRTDPSSAPDQTRASQH